MARPHATALYDYRMTIHQKSVALTKGSTFRSAFIIFDRVDDRGRFTVPSHRSEIALLLSPVFFDSHSWGIFLSSIHSPNFDLDFFHDIISIVRATSREPLLLSFWTSSIEINP
jgi:hypothetical protein